MREAAFDFVRASLQFFGFLFVKALFPRRDYGYIRACNSALVTVPLEALPAKSFVR